MTLKNKFCSIDTFKQVGLAFNCLLLSAVATVFLFASFPFSAPELYLTSLLSEESESI